MFQNMPTSSLSSLYLVGLWLSRTEKTPTIPACVVKTIRMEFPEENGKYAGFQPAEIDVNSSFDRNDGG